MFNNLLPIVYYPANSFCTMNMADLQMQAITEYFKLIHSYLYIK